MPVASRSVDVEPAVPAGVRMKARTTSTQPRSSGGDQAGRAADFIDSIDPKRTSRRRQGVRLIEAEAGVGAHGVNVRTRLASRVAIPG